MQNKTLNYSPENSNANDKSIICHNQILNGLMNAYYMAGDASHAKQFCIDYLSQIKNEPDFVYFMDILLIRLES